MAGKLLRRDLLGMVAWVPLTAGFGFGKGGTEPFRLALCNEVFKESPLEEGLKAIRRVGYDGVEVAPFTLSDDPAAISPHRRKELRRFFQDLSLQFVGFHWLLATPRGLHVTTPDPVVRERSWRYLARLVELCSDLGDGGVMVFGSGKQRSTTGGSTVTEAKARFREGLARLALLAEDLGVTILLEPLSRRFCNVVTTLPEAVEIVSEIGSRALATTLDVRHAVAESQTPERLVRDYFPYLKHVHLNEPDGGYPGSGDFDFLPLLKALKEVRYQGWLSVEVFDFTPGPERIATGSYRHIRDLESRLEVNPEGSSR